MAAHICKYIKNHGLYTSNGWVSGYADSISKTVSEMSVMQRQILLLTFHLLFQIKTCLCRGRPKGLAAPARAQLPPLSIWPRPCGPGGAARILCCSSGTPEGPPGEKRQGPYRTERPEMPASEYASVGPGREDAVLGGNDAKSVNMETRPHHCHRELRSTTLGGLTSADFRVVVGEQRQKWDSLQGTWEHCTLDPINLANVTDSCAFAIGKFVNNKIFIAWIELQKKKGL